MFLFPHLMLKLVSFILYMQSFLKFKKGIFPLSRLLHFYLVFQHKMWLDTLNSSASETLIKIY